MRPLEGIKVIDLSQFAAAPAVGRIFGEWGAEVIKVETEKGDGNRINGKMCKVPILGDDENPCFDTTSFFKKYISINLKSEKGQEILDRLLKDADVLILNFREPSAKRIHVDWETIHAKYPRIVYVRSTGFGDEGPMKDVGGFDLTAYGARGGVSGALGQAGGEPLNNVPSFGDFQQAMGLAAGALAALVGREKTGVGDRVVGNLYNTALFCLSWGILGTEGGNHYPMNRKFSNSPTANTYQCKDGSWLQLCGPNYNTFYDRCMHLVGRDDMVGNPKYNDWTKVQEEGLLGEVVQMFSEGFAKKNVEEWIELFEKDDYPCQKVLMFEEIVQDEQAWACHALRKVKYPSGREHLAIGLPMRLDSVGNRDYSGHTSRRIGADTVEILKAHGYTEEEIKAFAEEGVAVI